MAMLKKSLSLCFVWAYVQMLFSVDKGLPKEEKWSSNKTQYVHCSVV